VYKFEKLEVWTLAIEYTDFCYTIADKLPRQEEYNLASQIRRAAASVALNIAEGSTGQSDVEQARFLSMALRSLIETVACQHLIYRRKYLDDTLLLRQAYQASDKLAAKLQALRRALLGEHKVGEELEAYSVDLNTPFDELYQDHPSDESK
jgi:four helix bundle protein